MKLGIADMRGKKGGMSASNKSILRSKKKKKNILQHILYIRQYWTDSKRPTTHFSLKSPEINIFNMQTLKSPTYSQG